MKMSEGNVLNFSNVFTTYELMFGMLCLKIYLDLVKTYRPALVCHVPSYLEIIHVLHEMCAFTRVYEMGGIFIDPKNVKDQTIRGYLSQRKKLGDKKVASLLYTHYIAREDSEMAFRGNRLELIKYITQLVKEGEAKFIGKQKQLDMFQLKGDTKFTSNIEILVSVKLRSVL